MISARFAPWVGLASAALGAAVCAAVLIPGYRYRISQMELEQANALVAAREADIETLKLSKKQGDVLTAQLQKAESKLTKKERALRDAIATQTTGRACLDADIVRLLNYGPTDNPTGVPAAATGPAATHGAAASDTDIAGWANTARSQYDICRARLDALIDFHAATDRAAP